MRFCVINSHTPEYLPLARLTCHGNRAEYCDRHGYDLRISIMDKTAAWGRLRTIREALADGACDWVWCCGADVLNTNFAIRLEDIADPAFHVVIAGVWCAPVQSDSFLVRATVQGIAWVDAVLACYDRYKTKPWVENQAMIDLLPTHMDIIKVVPQRVMNSMDYRFYRAGYPQPKVLAGQDFFGNDGQWQPGDFVIHLCDLPLATRIEAVKKLLPVVQK